MAVAIHLLLMGTNFHHISSWITKQLIQVSRNEFPVLASGLAGQRGHVSLSCNDSNLVNSVQDQVEDAFLLKQILAIAQGSKFDLLLLVFCAQTKS